LHRPKDLAGLLKLLDMAPEARTESGAHDCVAVAEDPRFGVPDLFFQLPH
jgi:hypothetical protein